MAKKSDERKAARRAALKRDHENKGSGGGSSNWKGVLKSSDELEKLGVGVFKAYSGKDGEGATNKLFMLPITDSNSVIGLELWYHRNIGPNGDQFLCPTKMKPYLESVGIDVPEEIADGECPLCEEHSRRLGKYKEIKDELSEKDRRRLYAEVKAMRNHSEKFDDQHPRNNLMWVIDVRTEQTEDEGLKLFLMPSRMYRNGLIEEGVEESKELAGSPDEVVDVFDYMFTFKRKGTGLEDTEYTSYRLRKLEKKDTEWLLDFDDVPSIFDVLRFDTYDEMAAALSLSGSDEESKEEDEPKERRRRRKSTETKDEQQEEQPDNGDEEVVENKAESTRSRSRRRSTVDEEPKEDDEPEDDDSDESRIRRRRRVAAREKDGE